MRPVRLPVAWSTAFPSRSLIGCCGLRRLLIGVQGWGLPGCGSVGADVAGMDRRVHVNSAQRAFPAVWSGWGARLWRRGADREGFVALFQVDLRTGIARPVSVFLPCEFGEPNLALRGWVAGVTWSRFDGAGW